WTRASSSGGSPCCGYRRRGLHVPSSGCSPRAGRSPATATPSSTPVGGSVRSPPARSRSHLVARWRWVTSRRAAGRPQSWESRSAARWCRRPGCRYRSTDAARNREKDLDLSAYRFSKTHEWTHEDGGHVRVGITDYAQSQLGDVIFVELPKAGDEIAAGSKFGVIESVKAASDLYSPISGKVVAVNETLQKSPETVNSDP